MDFSKFTNIENKDQIDYEEDAEGGPYKKGNIIKVWGNKDSMNLNSMILTNILQSPYFKNHLSELTTYHELIDEIYYRVKHLEPWEKGSRKIGGQTGMCGGVRGVGAGGIVSTPFCILYKLFTIKLTRSQLRGMIEHSDSPYIRALGFMYIRFALHPEEFWAWFSIYLDDEEEFDAKAGGGCVVTIGEMVERLLTKLDWFSTLFPRIPVPIQKKIDERLREYRSQKLKNENDNRLINEMLYSRDSEKKTPESKNDNKIEVDNRKEKKRYRSESYEARYRERRHRSRSKEDSSSHRSHKKHKKHKKDRKRSKSRDREYRESRR